MEFVHETEVGLEAWGYVGERFRGLEHPRRVLGCEVRFDGAGEGV